MSEHEKNPASKAQQPPEAAPTPDSNQAPDTTPNSQPAGAETAAEPAQAAPPEAEEAATEETTAEKAKERKDWFGKKAREAEALKARLDAAENKAVEAKNQLLRTAAEYDNYRKRSAREADQKFNDGVSHAVNQILSILDTLDMAADAPCTDENYKKGVLMTLDKAAAALEKLGVTEIEADGQPFDPNLMNAVQQVPPEEGQQSGNVVRVFQKGYKIGDKIVRHATVVVAE
ncbi:MAG: nucleotide exchange factor GrpE [Gemmiger sp.]|nr:nucleotide exchange factor GrpE [Gemmiger sp.]